MVWAIEKEGGEKSVTGIVAGLTTDYKERKERNNCTCHV